MFPRFFSNDREELIGAISKLECLDSVWHDFRVTTNYTLYTPNDL